MPSERSLYRKIQLILELASSAEVGTLDELCAEIRRRRPPTFITRRYDKESDNFIEDVSDRVVRKTVSACRQLGLVGEDGRLSDCGREALGRSRFDRVLAQQVQRLLSLGGIQTPTLNEHIINMLRSVPPILPTAHELWTKSATTIKAGTFSRWLLLLAHCGKAQSSQRRIYLRLRPV